MALVVGYYGRDGFELIDPRKRVVAKLQASQRMDLREPTIEAPTLEEARGMAAWREMRDACRAVLARLDMEPADAIFPGSALRDQIRDALRIADDGVDGQTAADRP